MRATRSSVIDALGNSLKRTRQVLGWSIDEDQGTVIFFVPENVPLPPFPAVVDSYNVLLRPTSLPERD